MQLVRLRKNNRERRKLRVRKKVVGTAAQPRLSVFRSNKYIYAQLVDDEAGKSLTGVSSGMVKSRAKQTKSEIAFETGKLLAEKAAKAKVKKVVFDRSGYKYHGRVKSLAEGAREGGLEF